MSSFPRYQCLPGEIEPLLDDVHDYFNSTPPEEWSLDGFANDATTVNIEEFEENLRVIKEQGRRRIHTFAAKCYNWVIAKENEDYIRMARTIMKTKLSKLSSFSTTIAKRDEFEEELTSNIRIKKYLPTFNMNLKPYECWERDTEAEAHETPLDISDQSGEGSELDVIGSGGGPESGDILLGGDRTPPPKIPSLEADINFAESIFWNLIGMASTWNIKRGVSISASFERAKQAILKRSPQISLCQDNVADFCHNGELQDDMDYRSFCLALDVLPRIPNLPTDQNAILHRVFEGVTSWEELSSRVDDLMKVPNPVPAINSQETFANEGAIDPTINERQYFRDYVVELLRGALGNNDLDSTGRGKFADGASEVSGHQIVLSESSRLHRATAPKDQDDKLKLKRMLRDLFNFTILEMTRNKTRVSPKLTVFGTRTYKDTTEIIAMDYHGMYRTYCLGSFKTATTQKDAVNLLESFEMCLRFALAVKMQIEERSGTGRLDDIEMMKLSMAAKKLLTYTTPTPSKQQQQQQQKPLLQRSLLSQPQRYQQQRQRQQQQQQQQQQKPVLKRRRK
ncbi:hypothetical protein BGZ80_005078 [Entomortierella chlamydospora]|uniref:Uncharacterized protein n=1 Tax=Entomortierella chlamydospora TaxID=101097 RepID=A0A9P6MLT0_9FUNG|nr:hypothetical protein BGZ80_005078 [Entomortierella chlamydospora]